MIQNRRPVRRRKTKSLSERPAWDSSIHDLAKYRATKDELLARKLQHMSKHNTFSRREISATLGNKCTIKRHNGRRRRGGRKNIRLQSQLKHFNRAKKDASYSYKNREDDEEKEDDSKKYHENLENFHAGSGPLHSVDELSDGVVVEDTTKVTPSREEKEGNIEMVTSRRVRVPLENVNLLFNSSLSSKKGAAKKGKEKMVSKDFVRPTSAQATGNLRGIQFAFGKRLDVTSPRTHIGAHPWCLKSKAKKGPRFRSLNIEKKKTFVKGAKMKKLACEKGVVCNDTDGEILEYELKRKGGGILSVSANVKRQFGTKKSSVGREMTGMMKKKGIGIKKKANSEYGEEKKTKKFTKTKMKQCTTKKKQKGNKGEFIVEHALRENNFQAQQFETMSTHCCIKDNLSRESLSIADYHAEGEPKKIQTSKELLSLHMKIPALQDAKNFKNEYTKMKALVENTRNDVLRTEKVPTKLLESTSTLTLLRKPLQQIVTASNKDMQPCTTVETREDNSCTFFHDVPANRSALRISPSSKPKRTGQITTNQVSLRTSATNPFFKAEIVF
eukprot:g2695.t1